MERNVLVENRWLKLLEDKYQLENGQLCTYCHVEKSDAIMIIAVEAILDEIFTYIVKQYRHPIGQSIWQFPLGGFDATSEDAKEIARKELKEETGIVAGRMDYLGKFYADPGFSNQKMHVCATSDIQAIEEQQLEALEAGLICKQVSLTELDNLLHKGEMGDAWSICGYHFMKQYIASIR